MLAAYVLSGLGGEITGIGNHATLDNQDEFLRGRRLNMEPILAEDMAVRAAPRLSQLWSGPAEHPGNRPRFL